MIDIENKCNYTQNLIEKLQNAIKASSKHKDNIKRINRVNNISLKPMIKKHYNEKLGNSETTIITSKSTQKPERKSKVQTKKKQTILKYFESSLPITTGKINNMLNVLEHSEIGELLDIYDLDNSDEYDSDEEKGAGGLLGRCKDAKKEVARNIFSNEIFILNYYRDLLQYKFDLEQILSAKIYNTDTEYFQDISKLKTLQNDFAYKLNSYKDKSELRDAFNQLTNNGDVLFTDERAIYRDLSVFSYSTDTTLVSSPSDSVDMLKVCLKKKRLRLRKHI